MTQITLEEFYSEIASRVVSFVELWAQCQTRSMNMTNITHLQDESTYLVWVSTMITVFCSLKLSEVVIEGLTPSNNASIEEKKAYNALSDCALCIFVQVLSPLYKLLHENCTLLQPLRHGVTKLTYGTS